MILQYCNIVAVFFEIQRYLKDIFFMGKYRQKL